MSESIWRELEAEAEALSKRHLRDLFEEEPGRFAAFSLSLGDLLADFSKEKLSPHALGLLFDLAKLKGLEARRDALFAGEAVNVTERRAALHMAARDPEGDFEAGGEPVSAAVAETQERFLAFAEAVRTGAVRGSTGERFTDVISIGIGGSDLGPVMATKALSPWHDGPRLHYVSNVDGSHLADTVKTLDPARTLVIVQSKTFTTVETMTNARSALAWLEAALGKEALSDHLAAVSTNLEATAAFGVPDERVFGFWEWIGGRYSLWSAIGLPLAIALGAGPFREMLAGALALDTHFRQAPLEANLPMVLGLIGVWRRNLLGCGSVAVIPYDERLSRLPAYLQQLVMESNGKRVTLEGKPLERASGPVVWGEPGTNAQHSFFQLLHQGTDVIPVDFLLAAEPTEASQAHHAILAANCLAQSKALAFGLSEKEVRAQIAEKGVEAAEIERLAPHRTFPGDRPSSTLLYRRLDPPTLGKLIALYEHKTFVEAALWDINPFDQWGVELGKAQASTLTPRVEGEGGEEQDGSTEGLLSHFHGLRKKTP
ncbi:glucose-6-phosphate isomerase [Limibacillus halophilus]